uniref:Uncharacterized protein n=1 Tax=Anguilla anguilla TaxID=7936 RepID=A0A0E9QWD1_ANGAN
MIRCCCFPNQLAGLCFSFDMLYTPIQEESVETPSLFFCRNVKIVDYRNKYVY